MATVGPRALIKAVPPLIVVVAAPGPVVMQMRKVVRARAASMQAKAHAKISLVFILDNNVSAIQVI